MTIRPPRVSFSLSFLLLSVLWSGGTTLSAGDAFERITQPRLKQITESEKPIEHITVRAAGRLPRLDRGIAAPGLLVRTAEGNWSKVLLGFGFRKASPQPVRVLVLERFVTYRDDRPTLTSALDSGTMVFAGFEFDLDIGQVVPTGLGGDLRVDAKGSVHPIGETKFYPLPPEPVAKPEGTTTPAPNTHDGVWQSDFAGTFDLDIDGRWTGELKLTADDGGRVSGTFVSTDSRNRYPVTGRIGPAAHRVRLTISFDNADQTLDGHLWTTDKSRFAGTAELANRTFGFTAKRQTEK